MKKSLAIILALAMIFMAFAFTGCGKVPEYKEVRGSGNVEFSSDAEENEDTGKMNDLTMVKQKGTLVVGITEYPPMNYKENNEWTGFDTELAQAFADSLGVEVEFVILADWGAKFTDLKAGSIDCVWNGMVITDEALNEASVSDSYAQSSQVAVLSADKAAQVKSIEDLKAFTFAVEEDSAGQTVAKEKGLNSIAVTDMAAAVLEAASGASDGCIIDLTMANATVGKGTSFENLATVTSVTLSTEEFGVAFRKDSDLTAEFNAFLKEYKESGELAALAEKYNVEIK